MLQRSKAPAQDYDSINHDIIQCMNNKKVHELKEKLSNISCDDHTIQNMVYEWKWHAQSLAKIHNKNMIKKNFFDAAASLGLWLITTGTDYYFCHSSVPQNNLCKTIDEQWFIFNTILAIPLVCKIAKTYYDGSSYPDFKKIISQWEKDKGLP